ncbi:hypothetical protein B9Z55_004421 [Caenorhabditis nigoni]|uniref:Uncharacterized protein n=1 Tax=Caenorhabditis nigoni TaxID=1611254 RepID=A0A2G5UWA5_9PELO|nr:hypothetical protein B9Z55_004421 [Caenorhabditis nigoni]
MAQSIHCRYQKEIDDDMYFTYVSLEEMFSIYSSLSQLFSCPFHNWILRLDELKFKLFWEYTERILTLEFNRFTVRGGEMSNKSLAKLMDKIPENASFVIDSDISLDYSHAKALKFRSVEYEEARWLKLENLFSIRNSFISKFWKTNFDCSDVNKFLNYWSDCDKDMMEELTITLKEGTQIDEQELIKNLIVIYHNTDGYTRIFIIKLALSDFKMELWLQHQKYKILGICFVLTKEHPEVVTQTCYGYEDDGFLSVMFETTEDNKIKPITLEELDEEPSRIPRVPLEELFSIYSRLTRIFLCPSHGWELQLDQLELSEFREYTERILTSEIHEFTVRGGSITNELLAELMDKLPENVELEIYSDIPLDYSHAKALKFRSVDYLKAGWLKIEDLFSIRNMPRIKLRLTNFNCRDVNKFLLYWSDCDKDMMKFIEFGLKQGVETNKQEIFKNLTVISQHRPTYFYDIFYVKARNMENRKFVVGKLLISTTEIKLSACDPFNEDVSNEYSILELVHQKRDCEEKIRKMEKEFQGLGDAEKRKLRSELEELEAKLSALNHNYTI